MPNQVDLAKKLLYFPYMKSVTIRSHKQLSFNRVSGWGGLRKGAGRPNHSGTVNHMKREKVHSKTPIHATLKLREGMPSLRNRILFKDFKQSVRLASNYGLNVLHFSVQRNHIHLFVEAQNNKALALGMRSLKIRFAKAIRKYLNARNGRTTTGSVFRGRYHMRVLKTPREVKNALEYVLLNTSKHEKRIEYIDTYSSGLAFKNWDHLLGKRYTSIIKDDAEYYRDKYDSNGNDLVEVLSQPQSWLARVGWMRVCI